MFNKQLTQSHLNYFIFTKTPTLNLKLIYSFHQSLQLQALNHQVHCSQQTRQIRKCLALAGYTTLQNKLLLNQEYAAVRLLEDIIRDVNSLKAVE